MQKKIENQFPPGWDEARVRAVIEHYENQSEDQAVAEDEAALDEVMLMTGSSRTTDQHILLDEEGVPWIDGTNTEVVELVAQAKAHGWSAEELTCQHPHLTLGQVDSALGYYSDHCDEIDDDLARRAAIVEEIRTEVGEHPLVAKLRARIVPVESIAVTADELIAELDQIAAERGLEMKILAERRWYFR